MYKHTYKDTSLFTSESKVLLKKKKHRTLEIAAVTNTQSVIGNAITSKGNNPNNALNF